MHRELDAVATVLPSGISRIEVRRDWLGGTGRALMRGSNEGGFCLCWLHLAGGECFIRLWMIDD
jgi:hypothetical protein